MRFPSSIEGLFSASALIYFCSRNTNLKKVLLTEIRFGLRGNIRILFLVPRLDSHLNSIICTRNFKHTHTHAHREGASSSKKCISLIQQVVFRLIRLKRPMHLTRIWLSSGSSGSLAVVAAAEIKKSD